MKLPPKLQASIWAVETGQKLTPESAMPVQVLYLLMTGTASPLPPQGHPAETWITEIYAELVAIGAATFSREALEPTPQAKELGLSLLPVEWLRFMQKR